MKSISKLTHLDDLVFDNRLIRELPADEETINHRRQVIGACYSRVKPTPVMNPKCIAYSREVAALLDLHNDTCEGDNFTQVFAGNYLARGMESYATCYGGHQFGNWAGQLGDGRAILLGDISGQELQLKGAGKTHYSRMGDGRAVLRSSIREYLCSEAMHGLCIPTTRALCLVASPEPVRLP